MGWNQHKNHNALDTVAHRRVCSILVFSAIAMGVVVAGILLVFCLSMNRPVPNAVKPTRKALTRGTVSASTNAVTSLEKRFVPAQPSFVEVDGRRVYASVSNDVGRVVTNAFGKSIVIERVVIPNGPSLNGQSLVPRRIFKHDCEVVLDELMNMDLGYRTLMTLPANLDLDFEDALKTPIIISPDDTEDEQRRKREMIATKKELALRIANGERVSEIAAETLAYYNKIANLRDNLLQEVIDLERSGADGDDIEDAYEAANQMLKEYDALPLHSPKVRKSIIRERLNRKLRN